MNDAELIKAYLAENSQTAFAELVNRYVDMVYAAAFRQLCDRQLAEDVVQGVFMALAEKLRALGATPLGPWLYTATRFACVNLQRKRARQKRSETEARKMFIHAHDPAAAPPPGWLAIGPVLDDGLAGLSDTDRAVIVMRFFQQRQLKDIGAQIGTGESGAEKRVARALEKLRRFFARKGIVTTGIAVAALLSTHSVHAAPKGVATGIMQSLVACKSGLHVTSAQFIAKGLLKSMFIAHSMKWAAVAAIFFLLGSTSTLLFDHAVFSKHDAKADSTVLAMKVQELEDRLAEQERAAAQNQAVPLPNAAPLNAARDVIADPTAANAPNVANPFDQARALAVPADPFAQLAHAQGKACNDCHANGRVDLPAADPKGLEQKRLLLHLPFTGDLLDHSFNKFPVKTVGNVTVGAHTASFDGASWLELPMIPLDKREFAVSMWIKPSTASATGFGLITQNTENIESQLLHLILGRNMEPHLSFYENHLTSDAKFALTPNVWTHLVFEYAWKKQCIYMNGTLIAERWAGPYLGKSGPTLIGRPPQWWDHPIANFTGWMSDLRIYDGHLENAQIRWLAQNPPAKPAPAADKDRADAF